MRLRNIIISLLFVLLVGCSQQDNMKMPDLKLKSEIKSQISEKFAVDFMTYCTNAVKIRNKYVNNSKKFLSEESIEEKANAIMVEKWDINSFNDSEKEIVKKLLKFSINQTGIKYDYNLYLKDKIAYQKYEDELATNIKENDDIIKDLFNYFEDKHN
jgi:hypothetical protein